MSGADSCARKGRIEKHVIIGIHKRHGKILLYERYRAPNWKSRPLYILAAWTKLFAATRSKQKFNNPVSFDEKRGWQLGSERIVGKPSLSALRKSCPSSEHNLMGGSTRQCPGGEQLRRDSSVTVCRGVCLAR